MIQIAKLHTDDPNRLRGLQKQFDPVIMELLAMANDAGYSGEEALAALTGVVKLAQKRLDVDPDPADDPA